MSTETLTRHIPAAKHPWPEEEYAVRLDLSRAYRLAAQLKLTDHIYTHFSVRVPGKEEHFLINPYGLLFEEITPETLIKIDVRGNILEDPTGLGINEAGYVIHSAIHEARPDLQAILHTHTRDGVAVSAQREGLLPISQHALGFYSRMTYHDYEGIALDLDEQQRLVRDLGDSDVMILRNHGLLAAGNNIARAFRNLHMLERACSIQIAALAGGRENILLAPQEAIDKVRKQSLRFREGNDPITRKHWQALLRTLPDPDFQ